MNRMLLAFIVAIAVFVFGCVDQNQSGMHSPPVCKNMCPLGQTQAPYPDCSCLPTGASPSAGGNGSGETGEWVGPTPTPAMSTTPVLFPTPMEYGDVMLAGGQAAPRAQQGSLLVFVSVRNADGTPYNRVTANVGEISSYVTGEGEGWVFVSTGNKTLEFVGIGNKSVALALNRVWTGNYVRLSVEFNGIEIVMKDTGERVPVYLPKRKYVFVTAAPVSYGATSAIGLIFDLNKSLTRKESIYVFTPYVEVKGYHGINYILRDDGGLDMYTGEMDLSELARFNETGGAEFTVLDGTLGACVGNCIRNIQNCVTTTDPICHAGCASMCFGEPVP